jgi:hypothetical protein
MQSKLEQLIESMGRPGLLGLVGRTVEKRAQKHLAMYFRILGRRVAALGLESLVETQDKTVVRHAVEMRVGNTIRTMTPVLQVILQTELHQAMLAAGKIHHLAEADPNDPNVPDFPDPPPLLPPMMTGEEAALWASVHAGELIPGINDTTQALIADAIEQGIEDSLGVPGTARLLRSVLDDMGVSRSEMIASTEMNAAFSEATMRKLDRLGIEYKQWITSPGNVCDECSENEDASPIPLDEDFPSGDPAPPAHPNCRCAVTGARAPEAA